MQRYLIATHSLFTEIDLLLPTYTSLVPSLSTAACKRFIS